MNTRRIINRASGVLMIAVAAVTLLLSAESVQAQARIDGLTGTVFNFTAEAGEVSTPDGGSIHFWGYGDQDLSIGGLPQYPGPTLIVEQYQPVTITLTNINLPQATSIVFPGHQVTASGGSPGLLTQESNGPGVTVTYEFIPTKPGTYMYHSGTQMELQVEMGLVGAIIVQPNDEIISDDHAYNHPDTRFDHEYLFLLTSMDPTVHQLAEQGRFSEIDMTTYYPVYWFINGRAGPDDLADANVAWLPHQPYNCTPRMTPGQKLLMRIIGAGQGQHPFHFHGNNADLIARDGRLLMADAGSGPVLAPRSKFTTLTVPGETVDQIFTWTGEKMGWDIYGTGLDYEHSCNGRSVNDPDPASAGFDSDTQEYCPDHGKEFPVTLPEKQNLAFGGWYSGSPFMRDIEPLPPGEGGLNPNGGYFFMWHSHAEKELTNFDIFPGGMLTMMVVEPPGTDIP